jgi:hypothetical protein
MLKIVWVSLILVLNGAAEAALKNDQKGTCLLGEHWVRAYHQSAYTRTDGTQVGGSDHAAGCQKDRKTDKVWRNRLKSTFPTRWENKKEKPKSWTEEEKERVLEALSNLPDALLLEAVEGIYRMENYLSYPSNPAANHEHQIVLYDSAFGHKQNLPRIIAHEFAHSLYRQSYDIDKGVGYANAAEWIAVPVGESREIMLVPNRDGFVAEDGKEGPAEDFSNNIEYFLFNPRELQIKTPKVYDWIRQRYGDKFKLGKGR